MEDQEHSSGIVHEEDVGRECGANRTDKVVLQCGGKGKNASSDVL